MFSIKEIAERLKISGRTLRDFCSKENIGTLVGRSRVFTEDEVIKLEKLKREREVQGKRGLAKPGRKREGKNGNL